MKPIEHYFRLVGRGAPLLLLVAGVVLAVGITVILSLPTRYVSQAHLVLQVGNHPDGFEHGETEARQQLRRIETSALDRDALARIAAERDLFPDDEEPIDRLRRRLEITIVEDGPLAFPLDRTRIGVRVRFAHPDPLRAQAVVDDVVDLLIAGERAIRVGGLEREVDLVRREYEELRLRLGRMEAEIASAVRRHADILPERVEARLEEIERLSTRLQEIDEETIALADERRLMRFEYDARRARAPSVALEEQLETLRADYAALASIASDRHPGVRSLRERIEALERRVAAEGGAGGSEIADAADAPAPRLAPEIALIAERSRVAEERMRHLSERRTALADRLAAVRAIVEEAPEVATMMREFESRRDIVQRQLVYVGDRLSTAEIRLRIARDERMAQLAAIGPATLPDAPTGRRNTLFALLVVAALGAGIVALVVGDLLDGRVREAYDLGSLGAVPVVLLPTVATAAVTRTRRLRTAAGLVAAAAIVAATIEYGPGLVEAWGGAITVLSDVIDERMG